MAFLLGSETVWTHSYSPAKGTIVAQLFECVAGGKLEEIHAHGNPTAWVGSPFKIWLGIYEVSGGLPGKLLGQVKTETKPETNAWFALKLASPVEVSKGTKYYLAVLGANGAARLLGADEFAVRASIKSTYTELVELAAGETESVTKGFLSLYGTGHSEGEREIAGSTKVLLSAKSGLAEKAAPAASGGVVFGAKALASLGEPVHAQGSAKLTFAKVASGNAIIPQLIPFVIGGGEQEGVRATAQAIVSAGSATAKLKFSLPAAQYEAVAHPGARGVLTFTPKATPSSIQTATGTARVLFTDSARAAPKQGPGAKTSLLFVSKATAHPLIEATGRTKLTFTPKVTPASIVAASSNKTKVTFTPLAVTTSGTAFVIAGTTKVAFTAHAEATIVGTASGTSRVSFTDKAMPAAKIEPSASTRLLFTTHAAAPTGVEQKLAGTTTMGLSAQATAKTIVSALAEPTKLGFTVPTINLPIALGPTARTTVSFVARLQMTPDSAAISTATLEFVARANAEALIVVTTQGGRVKPHSLAGVV